jgi:hypothetical protein
VVLIYSQRDLISSTRYRLNAPGFWAVGVGGATIPAMNSAAVLRRCWPETVRDLCRRGVALVAGEQRGRGSGSGLSQAWHSAAPARPQESTEGLSTGVRHRRERSAGRVLPAAVRGGQCSWKEALGCAAELRVPRSAAHTGGEGHAEVKGPEEVTTRANCGGGAGGVRCRWLLQSKRR